MSQSVVQAHPMRGIKVGKVVVNIGLGKSGEAIERGKKVLEQVTGQPFLSKYNILALISSSETCFSPR